MPISCYQMKKAVTLLRAGREVSVSDGTYERPLSLRGAAVLVDGGEQALPPLVEGQQLMGVDLVFPDGCESVQVDPDCYDWEAPEEIREELRQKIQEIVKLAENNGIPVAITANLGNYGDEERLTRSGIFPQFSPAVKYALREPNTDIFNKVI